MTPLRRNNLQALFLLAGAFLGYFIGLADEDPSSRWVGLAFGLLVAGGLYNAPALVRRNMPRWRR